MHPLVLRASRVGAELGLATWCGAVSLVPLSEYITRNAVVRCTKKTAILTLHIKPENELGVLRFSAN